MGLFRLGWLYFRLGAMSELQYRANFFVAAFQSLLAVAVGLLVLALVYSHTTELNGWTESELLVVMGIQILLSGVIHAGIQPNMERLVEEVRDGKLDFALTRPEDAQAIVSLREVRIWQVVDVISGGIVIGVGVSRLGSGLGVGHAFTFLALLALGAVLLYCFWLIPGWLRYSMTYLVPIGFAVTVPAQALTARLHWPTVVVALGFAVALATFTRWFWRLGLRRYSGASA